LSGIAVVGADLSGARASRTRFTGAELEGVDLSSADLRGADFRGALYCESHASRTCRPVDAATLRAGSRSDLSGATLQ
ncbi:MAG: pentapeptide repeat-containing protein, partial [Candidatus Cybelea sp.]